MPPSELAGLFGCPHCHFAFTPRAAFMTLDYCPRCLARRRVAQPLQRVDAETTLDFGLLASDKLRSAPRKVALEGAACGVAALPS